MKSLKRIIKGILISLMVILMLGHKTVLFEGGSILMSVPIVRAADEETKTYEEKVQTIGTGAAEETPTTAIDYGAMVKRVADLATYSHRFFAPLINFFSSQIGNFLGTDYIYQGAMGKMLLKIWVTSRNIVNIAFVFILLWIALNTIFNPKSALDELKKKLLVFTLILVAVNFSWLGTKVVLDAANVMTYVTFAIPSAVGGDTSYQASAGIDLPQCQVNDPEEATSGSCYPTTVIAPTDSGTSNPLSWTNEDCEKVKQGYDDAYDKDTGAMTLPQKDENKAFWKRTSICYENLNLIKYDQNTAVIYLTYGMARIQNLVHSTANTDDVVQLSVGILLSLIIQLAYTIALFSLFFALIVRMAMLWLFVGFSPFLVFMLYFSWAGEAKNPFDALKSKFDLDSFLKWAFVPAKVGAIFAVSFIMISAGQAAGIVKTTLIDNAASKSAFVFKILEPQSLFMGIGSLQTFIWLLMCLGVLWMGVFAVLQEMPIVNAVTGTISGWGKGLAKMVATSPYWAPVLPLGKGGEKASIRSRVELATKPIMDMYKGYSAEQSEDVRALNKNAGSSAAKARVTEAIRRDFVFDRSQANQFASAHGLDLSRMMLLDPKTVREAFKRSGANDDQAGKIYDAIKKASEETPETRRERIRLEEEERAAANAAAGRLPAAPPAGTPPSPTPKPPAGGPAAAGGH